MSDLQSQSCSKATLTKLQKMLVLVCSVLLVTVLGCSSWMDGLTPTFIEPGILEYADSKPTIFTPYTSLWDAKRVLRDLDYRFVTSQTKLARSLEDNDTHYKHMRKIMKVNIASSEELRDTLFSPAGPLSILFAAVPSLALGGYLIQRPSDKKRIVELENRGGTHV